MKKSGIMYVGLCGRSGTGKGYVSSLFETFGIVSVDTDEVYRSMTGPCEELSPCMKELVGWFGDSVLEKDNSLNRKVLRNIVFSDENALSRLNEITHKHILAESERIAERYVEQGKSIVLIDAPLLFESGFDRKCEKIICVTCPLEDSIERIVKRDGLTRKDAIKRLSTQKSTRELVKLSDYMISNAVSQKKEKLVRHIMHVAVELKKIYSEKYEYGK